MTNILRAASSPYRQLEAFNKQAATTAPRTVTRATSTKSSYESLAEWRNRKMNERLERLGRMAQEFDRTPESKRLQAEYHQQQALREAQRIHERYQSKWQQELAEARNQLAARNGHYTYSG